MNPEKEIVQPDLEQSIRMTKPFVSFYTAFGIKKNNQETTFPQHKHSRATLLLVLFLTLTALPLFRCCPAHAWKTDLTKCLYAHIIEQVVGMAADPQMLDFIKLHPQLILTCPHCQFP
uniref:Uncharacterized protein n=1 Tax=Arundo donax TaxID=35708 RepID=A0A0A9FS46_ARUDO